MTDATRAEVALPEGWVSRQVIYDGTQLRLEYTGPALGAAPRVLVAFAPFDYPFQADDGGWGSRSFTKRGMAHVCVFHRNEDWHQHDEFFTAMQACRAFFGPTPDLTAYGFSMGGYGALLGAKALDARRAIAVSPQSSIDPSAVRFERRYGEQWARMDGWHHDLRAHMDSARRYIVMFDPLHGQDKKHEARLPKPAGYARVLLHGAGHAGIQTIVGMGQSQALFDLLRGDLSARALRHAYRSGRRDGFRYLRKLGTLLHEKNKPAARKFLEIAQEKGFHRLIKKWTPFYK
ncbi:hypothetical protein [Roseobacter sp. GAI101]|uniref:hypothetical protein n=1 Tax=Roseobacter sp. (strain GAI101) TaxID=391589 RepID=UPI0001871877|nr:hypothetical protein [Roseobacter sp. GAI101]EEB86047.1 hypothetical protein RGAI101_3203 [Roseobacter sp. GAI101]